MHLLPKYKVLIQVQSKPRQGTKSPPRSLLNTQCSRNGTQILFGLAMNKTLKASQTSKVTTLTPDYKIMNNLPTKTAGKPFFQQQKL